MHLPNFVHSEKFTSFAAIFSMGGFTVSFSIANQIMQFLVLAASLALALIGIYEKFKPKK